MSLLEKLLERNEGLKHLPRAQDENGFRHYIRAISYSSDFRRIEALPRRIYTEHEIPNLVEKWTAIFRTPKGRLSLWPLQAIALEEIAKYQGAFCPIAVGEGKALVSLLACLCFPCERPLLLVPAALREQTNKVVIPKMREHWLLPNNLIVRGYSELSLEKNKDMLETLKPDLIILDECHYVKQKSAGRTKRLTRYFREHPETKCVALSGTVSNRSLKDWAHIVQWCLRDSAPIPQKWQELSEWADCLDADVPDEQRTLPGALKRFCSDGDSPRDGFRKRLVETPGVIASGKSELGTSLQIISVTDLDIPSRVEEAINRLRFSWETPNGDYISEAVDLWRHIREVALGFWYRWEPEPPRDWLDARREWKKYVREVLKHNRRGLDTELQVWNESRRRPHKEWLKWSEIKNQYVPNTVAEWIDDFALEAAAKWLDENDNSICWYEHQAFGRRLAEYSGRPIFEAGDNSILETKETKIIATAGGHGEGKNLQRFSKNLIVSPSSSGKKWEQLLGRTHRHGQKSDEVECYVYQHVRELRDCFAKARNDAEYLQACYGGRQKLCYADIV